MFPGADASPAGQLSRKDYYPSGLCSPPANQGGILGIPRLFSYLKPILITSRNASYIRKRCGTRLRQTVFEAFRHIWADSFVTFSILCYNRHVKLKGE